MTTYVAHPEPRHIGAGRTFGWIGGGWEIFMRAPIPWLVVGGICLLYLVLASVPGPGSMLATVLFPLLMAGLMESSRVIKEHGAISADILLADIRKSSGNLLVAGVLLAVASLVSFAVWGSIVLLGGGISAFSALQNALNNDLVTLADLLPLAKSLVLALIVMLILMTLLMMAAWFAPALILFDGMTPLAAFKKSFAACLRNWLAMTVHGIAAFVLMAVATLTVIGLLVAVPVLAASVYLSYRDIFH